MHSRAIRLAGVLSAITSSMSSAPALAQEAYSDPAGSSVLVSALNWLQGTLLGTVATVIAVIAVACVGFMMLTGRINWRYGATVVVGNCRSGPWLVVACLGDGINAPP